MAAVKRTLFRVRLGDEDGGDDGDDEAVSIPEEGGADTVERGRPYVWIGLALASVAGLAAATYKLVGYWKSTNAEETAAPWRVEEDTSRLPDDSGTASLVGLGFVAGVAALGRRLERDDDE